MLFAFFFIAVMKHYDHRNSLKEAFHVGLKVPECMTVMVGAWQQIGRQGTGA